MLKKVEHSWWSWELGNCEGDGLGEGDLEGVDPEVGSIGSTDPCLVAPCPGGGGKLPCCRR